MTPRPGDIDIWARVQPHQWKWRRRTQPIRLVLIHSTRGGQRHPTEREFQALTNWELSAGNQTFVRNAAGAVIDVYGSMASRGIGAGGKLLTMMPDDVYPYASAGHMDPIAKSYEVCQSNDGMPYDPRDIDRLVDEVAEDCIRYDIPPRELLFVSGDNHEAPGIARHDRSANGKKWGKSDPGAQFPADFYARVERRIAELKGQGGMASEEFKILKNAIGELAKSNATSFERLENGNAFLGRIQALTLEGKTAQAERELRYVFIAAGRTYPE